MLGPSPCDLHLAVLSEPGGRAGEAETGAAETAGGGAELGTAGGVIAATAQPAGSVPQRHHDFGHRGELGEFVSSISLSFCLLSLCVSLAL